MKSQMALIRSTAFFSFAVLDCGLSGVLSGREDHWVISFGVIAMLWYVAHFLCSEK